MHSCNPILSKLALFEHSSFFFGLIDWFSCAIISVFATPTYIPIMAFLLAAYWNFRFLLTNFYIINFCCDLFYFTYSVFYGSFLFRASKAISSKAKQTYLLLFLGLQCISWNLLVFFFVYRTDKFEIARLFGSLRYNNRVPQLVYIYVRLFFQSEYEIDIFYPGVFDDMEDLHDIIIFAPMK